MSVYFNSNLYSSIQKYMSTVVSNPKLNLTNEQKTAFQEVLQDTTTQMNREYTRDALLSMQSKNATSGMLGIGGSSYSNLMLSAVLGGGMGYSFGSSNNLSSSILPALLSSGNSSILPTLLSSGYLTNSYRPSNLSYYI